MNNFSTLQTNFKNLNDPFYLHFCMFMLMINVICNWPLIALNNIVNYGSRIIDGLVNISAFGQRDRTLSTHIALVEDIIFQYELNIIAKLVDVIVLLFKITKIH